MLSLDVKREENEGGEEGNKPGRGRTHAFAVVPKNLEWPDSVIDLQIRLASAHAQSKCKRKRVPTANTENDVSSSREEEGRKVGRLRKEADGRRWTKGIDEPAVLFRSSLPFFVFPACLPALMHPLLTRQKEEKPPQRAPWAHAQNDQTATRTTLTKLPPDRRHPHSRPPAPSPPPPASPSRAVS